MENGADIVKQRIALVWQFSGPMAGGKAVGSAGRLGGLSVN